jgi:hypothetical protein
MALRQHPLMKDARHENTFCLCAVENHMLAMLMSTKAATNVIRGTANSRILSKDFTTFLKRVQIAKCLEFAPDLKRVAPDLEQVRLGSP